MEITEVDSLLDFLSEPDRCLVLQLFGCFAHAEYTLKGSGFIKRGSDNAEADWQGYSRAIAGTFHQAKSPRFRAAWRLFAEQPPQKQIIREGRLAWKDDVRAPRLTDEEYGLLLVRRVRNNLVHGAKFLVGGERAYSRDRHLVRAALTLLEVALSPSALSVATRQRSSG
jgi:hypothetical protein